MRHTNLPSLPLCTRVEFRVQPSESDWWQSNATLSPGWSQLISTQHRGQPVSSVYFFLGVVFVWRFPKCATILPGFHSGALKASQQQKTIQRPNSKPSKPSTFLANKQNRNDFKCKHFSIQFKCIYVTVRLYGSRRMQSLVLANHPRTQKKHSGCHCSLRSCILMYIFPFCLPMPWRLRLVYHRSRRHDKWKMQ